MNSDNVDLASKIFSDRSTPLADRAKLFSGLLSKYKDAGMVNYHRLIMSPADREVVVYDEKLGR